MLTLCACLTTLCCGQQASSEAATLVEQLRSLHNYAPATINASSAFRRLIVLDFEAVPALVQALQAPHATQRAAAAIALRYMRRLQPVVKVLETEPDSGVRFLFARLCEDELFIDLDPNRGNGLEKSLVDAVETIIRGRIELRPDETKERSARLLKLLNIPIPRGPPYPESDEHGRARDVLSLMGNDVLPILTQELCAGMAGPADVSRMGSLTGAITQNIQAAHDAFLARRGDARLLGQDHASLLKAALDLSSLADDRLRCLGAQFLATLATLQHERLAPYSADAEKRLLELRDDPDDGVRKYAESGLAAVKRIRDTEKQKEEGRLREAEKQRTMKEREEARARAYEAEKKRKGLHPATAGSERESHEQHPGRSSRRWWPGLAAGIAALVISASWLVLRQRR